jgi:hypothetical protein
VITSDVAGGLPETVIGVWAVEPIYGVIEYPVGGEPPEGAVQDSDTWPTPAVASTPVGALGADPPPPPPPELVVLNTGSTPKPSAW